MEWFLEECGIEFSTIRSIPDPMFGGLLPEPIPENLGDMSAQFRQGSNMIGLATDGDADRFAVVDENGKFVQLHDLMPLLFRYLLETRDWQGDIVRTTSMADTIDHIAAGVNRQVYEVPVGFKNITEVMLTKDIIIGGEESGGFGYKNHIPERDGILSALLVLEMLADKKQKITELIAELRQQYGPFAYKRIDTHGEIHLLNHNLVRLQNNPPQAIDGKKILNVLTTDGIKFKLEDHTWMLIRVSQTEPLARIYVGGSNEESVNRLALTGKELITRPENK